MHSILKLYNDEFLQPANHYCIEGIEGYLAQNNPSDVIVRNDFQYQRQELNKTIKVSLPQEYLDSGDYGDKMRNSNYCSIQNVEDDIEQRIYYYFITAKHWKSPMTIEFELEMDVLNTFRLEEDYVLGNKTIIKRQHKNRYIKQDNKLIELYHPYPEGINPQLFTSSDNLDVVLRPVEMDVSEKSSEGRNWYLMYRTDYEGNDVVQNPISTYLFTDERLKLTTAGLSQLTLLSSQFISANAYLIVFGTGFSTASQVNINGTIYQLNANKKYYLTLCHDGTTLKGSFWETSDGITASNQFNNRNISSITFYQNTQYYTSTPRGDSNIYPFLRSLSLGTQTISNTRDMLALQGEYFSGYQNELGIKSYNEILCLKDIDRTDSRINKIVILPSCPIHSTFDNITDDFYYDEDEATLVNGLLKINPSASFLVEFQTIKPFDSVINLPSSFETNRYLIDPKLKTSEFNYEKYFYDSFGFILKMENMSNANKLAERLPITFKASHLFNSRFLYKFGLQDGNVESEQHTEDYPNLLIVDRNNEITIYNNEYIQYMKNGYNYDVKAKNINWAQNVTNLVSSALMVGNGSNPFQSANAVGGFINATKDIYFSSIRNQLAIDRTIGDKQLQHTSVAGADDMDLLQYYNGNRLQHKEYRCSKRMYELVDDMFYYLGYNDNTQEAPNIETRMWFNYLECDAVISNQVFTSNITSRLMELFKGGVTFFHNRNGEWDMLQKKENFETSILY